MSASIDNEHLRNVLFSWPEMAIVLIYDNFYEKLIRIADMRTRDRQASEDVIQEVFTDIWQRHKAIATRRDEPIQNYLIRAVQYHSISYYRKRSTTTERERKYYYSQINNSPAYPVEANIISEERRKFIRAILGTLPAKEKECLLLQIDQGLSVKEIALRLRVTVKAVERSLTSARKRLRRFGSTVS